MWIFIILHTMSGSEFQNQTAQVFLRRQISSRSHISCDAKEGRNNKIKL